MVMGRQGVTTPVLDLYEDFDCPVCKELHATVNATIMRLARDGKVKVVFHTVTIFSDEPMRSNSVRAAAASRCVPAAGWLAFRDAMYAIQPAPHGSASGFTQEELVKAATPSGKDVADCVARQTFRQAHLTQNETLTIDGTPTVLLDGRQLGNIAFDPDALTKAVEGGQGQVV